MPDHPALLDRRLDALRSARPELARAIALQEALIRGVLSADRQPVVQPFPLPRQRLLEKVHDGVPLLHGEPAFVDLHFAADLFSRLLNGLVEGADADTADRVGPLVAAATEGRLDPNTLFTEAFVQHHDHLAEMARGAGIDDALLLALAALAVGPLLRAYAARLDPLLSQVQDPAPDWAEWSRGYCPLCGAWPLLGELRGVELRLYLRCAGCGYGWRGRRMACPYCGTDDFHQLGSLRFEGEQRFTVQVCQRCHGYLKVGNAFDPPPAELLPLDDLASAHLDMAAIDRGYARPSGTGFRLELAVPESAWAEELE